VIFPVPVTLNLFLALEFVLTLGICCSALNYTLEAFLNIQDSLRASSGNTVSGFNEDSERVAKVGKYRIRLIRSTRI
jgi:hypothetical protein